MSVFAFSTKRGPRAKEYAQKRGRAISYTVAMYEELVRRLGYGGERDTAPRVVGIREKIEVHSQVLWEQRGRGIMSP